MIVRLTIKRGGYDMTKTELRALIAITSGRVSAAKIMVKDLESMQNDIKIKLERARDELARAEQAYVEADEIITAAIDAI